MKKTNKNRAGFGRVMYRALSSLFCLVLLLACSSPAYAANEIMEWDTFKGAVDLLEDLTQVFLYLIPLGIGAYAIYCAGRRAVATQEGNESYSWTKKIKDAVFWGCVGFVADGFINLLLNYVS